MLNKIKLRFERYFRYMSDETIDKTYERVYGQLSWDMHQMGMEDYTLHSTERGVTDDKYFAERKVVVSLTTYGKRLYEVHLAIESIMQQTVKPNRIILWLQDDMQDTPLPISLQKQVARGLEIGYCKDIKSYKKLIPSLQQFPDDIIITIDDDIIFAHDMLEVLLNSYKTAPEYIHTNRAHIIKMKDDGSLMPYNDWEMITSTVGTSPRVFPTGGAGTLYPPHSLSEEVLNEEAFMSLCPKGDDIWFKAMSLLNGTQCYRARTHEPYLHFNPNVQDIALWNDNVTYNDIQIKAVFDKYDLYKHLK